MSNKDFIIFYSMFSLAFIFAYICGTSIHYGYTYNERLCYKQNAQILKIISEKPELKETYASLINTCTSENKKQ